MPPCPSAQAIANAQQPSDWTQTIDAFVERLVQNGESAESIVELVLAEYSYMIGSGAAVAAWIWKRVQELQ